MSRLAVLGASGHGKVVADCAELVGWSDIVFFDDAWPKISKNGVWNVAGDSSTLLDQMSSFDGVIVAIGNNSTRMTKIRFLQSVFAPIVSVVHPAACVSRYAAISIGSTVFANAVINAGTQVGAGAIVNTSSTIDHDCVVGNGVHISPGAHIAGNVRVGDLTWIGIGASIRNNLHIGNEVMVGVGAAVVKNVADNQIVFGVPAKEVI